MEFSQLKELDDKYILNSYKRYPLQVVSGKGVYVFDENGNKYLDFLGGIAVNALGYSHPKVIKAIKDQLEKLIHISNLFYTETPVILAHKLCEISSMDKVFFCNSGAEANELAIKLARLNSNSYSKDKTSLVCLNNSFHGRTIGSLTVTKNSSYAEKFLPLTGEAVFININNVEELVNTVNDKTACIIIEPIQGEGGINLASKDFLQQARCLADKYNALLIFDEVQAGLGRTGDYFSYQFSAVEPDIITIAKPLGAGLPIGAVLMKEKIAKMISYGDHGSTFGANCVTTASALAFLEVIEQDNLLENVKSVGNYLFNQLENLRSSYSFIKEVRGRGLILGIELEIPVGDIHLSLMKRGLITNSTSERVIRLLPPYVITKNNVDEAISIIDGVFSEVKS
ncbi:MAG: aspartate aminotransferase family protein [Cyanobacteriota bacterium]